jgi:ABC-type transport system involved in multi-copper enzyme maturation permease subunit
VNSKELIKIESNLLNKIYTIAKSTAMEIIYDKVFLVIIISSFLIIPLSRILGLMTPGQELKLVVDIGINCIYFCTLLITIFSGAFLINRELEKNTILLIISKPVNRYEFVLGKYFGMIITIVLMIVLMSIVFFSILLGFDNIDMKSITNMIFINFIEICLIASFSILFSSFCNPVLGIILTIFVLLMGYLIKELDFLVSPSRFQLLRRVSRLLSSIFPNFSNFNIVDIGIQSDSHIFPVFLLTSFYGIFYIVLVLALTVLIFRKRIF